MEGGLILLIVGTVAGVGGPALGIWLWVRHRRSAALAGNRRDLGGSKHALVDASPNGVDGAADLAQEDVNLVLNGLATEWSEKSAPNENSDLAGFAPGAAQWGAPAVVPAAPVEIAIEAAKDSGGEHGRATVEPAAASTELVLCGLDVAGDGSHGAARDATVPALRPADMTDMELSANPGPASAEAPAPPAAAPPEAAQREAAYGTPRPSEEAQPQEFPDQDESLEAEGSGEPAHGGSETVETAETAGGAECGAVAGAPCVGECAVSVAPGGNDLELAPEPELVVADALQESIAEDTAGEAANGDEPARMRARPSRPAQHRDRRGQRRALPPRAAPVSEQPPPVEASLRAPAEAKLRLILHPIRRTATLSAVLARPPGYPDHINLLLGEGAKVRAYSEDRYDDVDLAWTADLLSGEVRLDCEEGYQWLRSGRRIHLFSEVADEPGAISVGSAALSSATTIICLHEDAAAVSAAAEACGSPALVSHDHWGGIPDGWTILSGYQPTHAAAIGLEAGLTGLDPGVGSEIRLSGGLRIRSASFAEGSPPRIEIAPFPSGATVTIDGQPAELGEDGAWSADGWDRAGDHLVDVVPGPSAAYRIIEDPWAKDGWEAWDAHSERFSASPHVPWAVAQVCGAAVLGPAGEYVVAADAMLSVVCLGLRRGAVALRGRPDVPVAVGLLREPPAFLISASGPRRSQGRIAWLSPSAPTASTRAIDPQWVAEVRRAASRRLALDGGGLPAEDAWRRARERARRQRRPRS